jgi:hypothetical protein
MAYGKDTDKMLEIIKYSSYRELDLSWLTITHSPPLPYPIKKVIIRKSPIEHIPSLPESIIELDCYDTKLITLPHVFPETLTQINVTVCPLDKIIMLPQHLKKLCLSATQIKILPTLPLTLKYLICNNTPLTCLPILPPKLEELYLLKTQISTVPELPNSLKSISVESPNLTYLTPLPDSLTSLYIVNTPLLFAPQLRYTQLYMVNFTNLNIKELPQFPETLQELTLMSNNLLTKSAVTVSNKAESSYGSSARSWTCGTTGNTIYGYWVANPTNTVLWAERFAVSRVLANGDQRRLKKVA